MVKSNSSIELRIEGSGLPCNSRLDFLADPCSVGATLRAGETGAAKFLEVAVAGSDGTYTFTVNNTLASQGQHFMLQVPSMGNWTINGRPNPGSLEGGASSSFTLDLTPGNGVVAPLRLDFTTGIGGRQSWFAYANAEGVQLTQDEAMAVMFEAEVPVGEESPGIAVVAVLGLVGSLGWMRRRFE